MQEKAWSTGGLKKFLSKNTNVYKKASNLVFNTNVTTTTYEFEPVRVGQIFIINKTKKWVAYLEPTRFDDNAGSIYYTYFLYQIDYNNFINEKAITLRDRIGIESALINANTIKNEITIGTEFFPCTNNDEIEIIYESVIYAYLAEI